MKIEIKNRYTNEVIFSHECDDNTIKTTILKAVEDDADLWNADLSDADLSDADLSDADLSDADLRNADLRNADLSDADLSDANLRNANLRNADLSDADLRNADLSDANLSDAARGNCNQIKTMQTDIWNVVLTSDVIAIGCEQHTVEEWKNFTDDEIACMESRALDFWKKWKDVILQVHKIGFES